MCERWSGGRRAGIGAEVLADFLGSGAFKLLTRDAGRELGPARDVRDGGRGLPRQREVGCSR